MPQRDRFRPGFWHPVIAKPATSPILSRVPMLDSQPLKRRGEDATARTMRVRVRVLAAAVVGALVIVAGVSPAESAPAGRASGCESSASPGISTQTIDVQGVPRQYRLAVPEAQSGERRRPLILNFHGGGRSDALQANYSELEEKGPARGFVVITPNAGSPPSWARDPTSDSQK